MIRRRSTKRSTAFCGLETLESRQLMSVSPSFPRAASFVYTETENTKPGQNAVVAFRQSSSGTVTEIGSFKTDGTGSRLITGCSDPKILIRKSSPVLTDVFSSQSTKAATP